MQILGIETSCDDTSVAIYDDHTGLVCCLTKSQSKIHSQYGGVVPEIAARLHLKNIFFLLKSLFKNSNVYKKDICAVAYTVGPGLSGSLLVGASVANSLAYLWKIPVVFVNHMEAHLFSYMLNKKCFDKPKFPLLSLLVSGGHTQIVVSKSLGKYHVLGNCLDDSAGEVIDKVANMLGLQYPGGAKLSKLASLGKLGAFKFPRPMINSNDFNFSFSGLKTHVSRIILKNNINSLETRANVARELENSIVSVLVDKCFKAMKFTKLSNLVISGGVSANHLLRKTFRNMSKNIVNCKIFFTNRTFCTDNAAMIAYLGMLYFKNGFFSSSKIFFSSKLSISNNIYLNNF
ncbi:tRNA (adenosine(37)-N6)-threonylcarbamoyltransferase complex transferase subunit TsaD [Buchnera aphidicola (Chaitoregma tattakana)]|uniref:tRNA (adenosine(37)-N6)-threonylcarbamoyltransferase complex transferase subunit TsaD n=1 Tax=Buchnera aphidicola TaxID=9 RepID=UPI0031B84E02